MSKRPSQQPYHWHDLIPNITPIHIPLLTILFFVIYIAPRIINPIHNIPEIVLNNVEVDCSIEGAFPVNVTWYVICYI